MSDVELDYDYFTQRALRRVVHDVLSLTAELGAPPGDHRFFIEFQTTAFGVSIPDELRETYPDRMTIVLQHQFEHLTVGEDAFSVSLWFKGKQSRLTISFEAVTSFADPSVQFGLRFQEPAAPPGAEALSQSAEAARASEPPAASKDSADVVRLDTFRKK